MLLWPGYFIVLTVLRVAVSDLALPGLKGDKAYKYQGDIMLGVFEDLLQHGSSEGELCSDEVVVGLDTFKNIGALQYAIDLVNNNTSVLPGVTIGFIALPTCNGHLTTLARALQFVPQSPHCQKTGTPHCDETLTPHCDVPQNPTYLPFYKVVGVLGATSSQSSVMSAPVLGLAQIPQISNWASSDELSNKELYPYFMRVAPPDRYQAQAIVDIIRYFNWTYVSTLHRPDSYGQNGIKMVHRLLKQYDICLEYNGVIHSSMEPYEFEDVHTNLKRNNKPKAVIVFAYETDLEGLLDVIKESNGSNEFIWVGSDGVYYIDNLMSEMVGAIKVDLYYEAVPAIDTYIKSLTPNNFTGANSTGEKWIRDVWENNFDCSFDVNAANSTLCGKGLRLNEKNGYTPYDGGGSSLIDAINVFAHGLHELITNECPLAFNNTALLDTCIKGPLFKQYLLNTNFTGVWGPIRFDKYGDILGRYSISQIQIGDDHQQHLVPIGIWDKQKDMNLDIHDSKLKWHHHKDRNKLQNVYPESMCSYPCRPGEFYIKQELKCCWECRKCRTNEITINNASTCKECPIYKWPDQLTFGYCVDIQLNYLLFSDSLGILMTVLSSFGFLACMIVLVIFIRNRNHKLVKASNRELTSIILAGTMIAYVTVYTIIAKPDTVYCYLSCLGFHISSSLAYAPMLVKTNRVFRIFEGGKKFSRPSFITSRWQAIFTAALILIQMIISFCLTAMLPPVVTRNQPVLTEKFVELLCWIPLESLIVPLVYNLVLIILCAIHGFKTRTLPDNFNESRFIFFSVSTTLFLWIAFLPTYFTASSAYHKATLLSALLILNASITLLVLFLPKLYAIYYLSEAQMKFTASIMAVGIQPSVPATQMSNLSLPPGPSRFNLDLRPIGSPLTQLTTDTTASVVTLRLEARGEPGTVT
ncbi:unnamed protein product [Owenia fusiformis]|uniref:Uncharacterized protein n=1 Tax=Owenia fusiformis TaxID=6347 RepID=A0A8J1UT60_OWEFU|nr:unnamed protein product [Owenia fusiformis]